MSMIELTPELRRLMEHAGERPVRIEDPEMHHAYVLIRADVDERVRNLTASSSWWYPTGRHRRWLLRTPSWP
jgi:hypothetical protein